jgi:hypothetical protein
MVAGTFGSGSTHIHTLGMPEAHTYSTTLRLPPVNVHEVNVSISFHAGPFVTRSAPETPFSTDSASLYVVQMTYTAVGEEVYLPLVIHNRTLRSYLSLSECAPDDVKVAWEDWGLANTRFLDADCEFFGRK